MKKQKIGKQAGAELCKAQTSQASYQLAYTATVYST